MTRKTKAADLDTPEAVAVAPETGAPMDAPVAPAVDPAADGIDDADQPEGNQPETQQAQVEQQKNEAAGNQSPETDIPVSEAPASEPSAEDLKKLANRITDMLPWRRTDLIAELVQDHGMTIKRSIGGVDVSMAGITALSLNIGPNGDYQALANWANAARRKVLELQTAGAE